MREEVRQLWLDALRSGEYGQGSGFLAQPNPAMRGGAAYCCLGVLCELAVKNHVIADKVLSNGHVGDGDMMCYKFVNLSGELPYPVVTWAGLSNSDPRVYYGDLYEMLSTLNDDHELTFAEIADVIESQL